MKAANVALMSLMLAFPAAAQSQPGDFEPVDEPTQTPTPIDGVRAYFDQRVDEALAQLVREAQARGVTRETFNLAAEALQARAEFGRESLEEASDVWQSLSDAVRRLETQARSALNDAAEAHAMQMAVLERRLDMAIEDLADAAFSRGVSRELYNRHVALLEARAAAADEFGPVVRSIHNRLASQVELLVDRVTTGNASVELFQEVRLSILRERLNEALQRLQEAAAFRGATREDYNRVAQAYENMAQAQAQEIQSFGY